MSKIAGGLLSGLGRGLMHRADTDREDVLIMREQAIQRAKEIRAEIFGAEQNRLDREHETGERSADRTARTSEAEADRASRTADAEADREQRRGLLIGVEVGDDRRARGVRAGGETVDLGFDAPPPRTVGSSSDDSGLSAGDQREIELALETNTTQPEFADDPPVVDYVAAAAALRRAGRPDLAARITKPGAGTEQDPHQVSTVDEFEALPVGAYFIDTEDGQLYRKK